MKSLVLCYSMGGRTAMVGKAIAEALGGEFELVEEQEKRKGIGGMVRGAFDAISEKKTAIQKIKTDVAAYDRIVIGTPVWAGKPAPAMNMLIEMIPLRGKIVDIYVTMGSSNPGNAIKILLEKVQNKEGQIGKGTAVKTGGVPNEELIRQGREFGQELMN